MYQDHGHQPCPFVLQELDRLEADSTVYKMVGPVLVKQDLEESRQNVQKRIDFIKGEM